MRRRALETGGPFVGFDFRFVPAEDVFGETVQFRAEAFQYVRLAVHDGFQQSGEDLVAADLLLAQELVGEDPEGVGVGMADGDDLGPHEDEGDFRKGRGFRIHPAENRGGHETGAVFRVQAAGGLNFPHFIVSGHLQAAEAFHEFDFPGFRREKINPEDAVKVLCFRIHLGGALNAFRGLTIKSNHAVDVGRGGETVPRMMSSDTQRAA